ncbi:hypothetical protein QCA50_000345 [Cerrena zonata]|uniref:Uncharacterized protein n=1 Tax=Cerrena zonata TaxID=2478898 RepID=A0AAW0GZW8_9APHY
MFCITHTTHITHADTQSLDSLSATVSATSSPSGVPPVRLGAASTSMHELAARSTIEAGKFTESDGFDLRA